MLECSVWVTCSINKKYLQVQGGPRSTQTDPAPAYFGLSQFAIETSLVIDLEEEQEGGAGFSGTGLKCRRCKKAGIEVQTIVKGFLRGVG